MTAHPQERLKILLRGAAIRRRVRELGRRIARDFRGQPVHLVGVLNGAAIFAADLIREIPLETSLDFMAVSSYGMSDKSSGKVRVTKDLDGSIEGRNVILVDDILDTGCTIHYLQRLLLQRNPRSLRIAVLLDKDGRRLQPVEGHYVGFRIANYFVVGYGLDYAGRYRNLKDICLLSEEGEPASQQRSERLKSRRQRAV
jgi:hypoxanthine phosphoribosyltransferase